MVRAYLSPNNNGVPGRKINPLGALVNIVCFNGQMATHCCYPIKALFTFISIGLPFSSVAITKPKLPDRMKARGYEMNARA